MLRRRTPKPKTPLPSIPLKKVKRLKLAELMEERRVSAYTLGKILKVSSNTIRAHMSDEGREPSYSLIINLKTYFGLERDEDLVEFEEVTD